ncbi:hypothetical protein TNIN_491201 [Trichonephila inaurata madagascariensis]|uniref:Uncharacterized protein n=1 Tax=Trichonephila inaurata madagascariensis TaxID=2747483 RepID=A0A8X6WQX9_9ARAC|nr:hypothetical protein TNIN_491201 [Trichonephila inaurata madagascariensis]
MPYGAKEGCSKIFKLFCEKFSTVVLDFEGTINAQLIERIAKSALSEEAAKKLTASEGQGIPPPQSADQTASTSTLPRRRKPGSLSYSQWKRKGNYLKSLEAIYLKFRETESGEKNHPREV